MIDYAPFSGLFRRAASIVRQDGIGSTGQATRGTPHPGHALQQDLADVPAGVVRVGIARAVA